MRKLIFVLFLIPALVSAQQKVLVVADFTTKDFIIEDKMRGVTDVLRSELAKSNIIRIVDRSNFEQVFGELALQRQGITDPSTVKDIGRMLNADYLITGTITRQGNIESSDVFGQGITASLAVQMIDVKLGQVIAAAAIAPVSWNDYMQKIPAFARQLLNRVPSQAVFGGTWEASVEHDGIEDMYTINFKPDNTCAIAISSFDANNRETTQTAEGNYTLNNDILSISANFRRGNTIKHILRIEWKATTAFNNERNSFNIVIPVSSASGAKRVRAVFRKK